MRKPTSLLADNLLQGISEQVPAMRTLNHQNDRVNLLPSAIYGNIRRPQSYMLGTAHTSITSNSGFHHYTRDEAERYLVVTGNSIVRVYDLFDGSEVSVAAPNGFGYLNCTGHPRQKHRFLTAGDYTFIANRDVTVAMDAAQTAPPTNNWIVYCKQGDYATTYSFSINGVEVATFKTDDETQEQTGTDYIVGRLAQALNGTLPPVDGVTAPATLPAGFEFQHSGSVIELWRTDGASFSVTASDSLGNTSLLALNDSIQRFDDLPPRAPDGFLVKVSGDSRSEYDDYYVKFVADDPDSIESAGIWQETIAPGIDYRLDPDTMPHILVRESDGTFTFRPAEWGERKVGGALSSPRPSFVGKRIENLFFFADRLGFLHGSTMTTTCTRQYFNFWRKTARTVLETDPIDISAQTSEALTLRYAFPFDESLVILADRGQLVARGSAKFTPENASLTVTSHYEMDPESIPDVAGTSLFFSITDGLGTSLMEMQVQEGSDKTYAVSISEHVPSLLPNMPCSISASSSQRGLIVTPHNGAKTLFMFSWLWSGRERVLASWHKLTFGDPREGAVVLWAVLENSIGYLLVNLDGVRVLLRMDLNDDGTWRNTVADIHLDFVMREGLDVSYDSDTGLTTVTMPLALLHPSVIKEHPNGPIDLDSDIAGLDGNQLTIFGEHTDLLVGSIPECYIEFSEPFPKKHGPRGEMVSNVSDRLQLSQIRATVNDSGPFQIEVYRANRDPMVTKSWGQRFDDAAPVLAEMPVNSDVLAAPIKGSSKEVRVVLRSQGFYPLNLIAAEWTGLLLKRRK